MSPRSPVTVLAARSPSGPPETPIAHLAVSTRGTTIDLPLSEVDWIETQGNYVGLHVGGWSYLVRSTLLALEAKLDPRTFVRVHRRWVVAIDRVVSIEALANGDAVLRLRDGQSLRLSRSFRVAFLGRWHGPRVSGIDRSAHFWPTAA